jgi:hypothetical protein
MTLVFLSENNIAVSSAYSKTLCKKTVISNGENHRQNKPKHINYHKNSYFHKFRGKGEVRITACAHRNAANAFPKKYSR